MSGAHNESEAGREDRFEERYRRMVDDSPAVLWAFDEVNGRMIYVNPAVEEALGHDRRRFYERSTFWLELIHADDRKEASAANHDMRTEKKTISYIARLRNADGGYTRLRIIVKPVLDERGNIVRTEGAAIREYE
jgi:PAS domain S-box-containing protein